MGSKIISRKRLVLLIMIILTAGGGGFLLAGDSPDYAILPWLFTIALSASLMADIRRNERIVSQFFETVASGDLSTTFDESDRNPVIRLLHSRMNKLIGKIQALRIKSEANELYYRIIIQQSATGLVVLNAEQEIELINRSAAWFAGISPDSSDNRLLRLRNPLFFEQLRQIGSGESITFRTMDPAPDNTLLLKSIRIEVAGSPLKVISIENIRRELDHTELESYQRLIRVLTHEIMNSVAPLSSVSGTLQSMFNRDKKPIDPARVDGKLIHALIKGLSTIDDQTRGMVRFVNDYRKLTRLPDPVITSIDAVEWLEKLRILAREQMENAYVQFQLQKDPGIRFIFADINLIDQVILNLVNNAREALLEIRGRREIRIKIFRPDTTKVYIKVSNNGPAIPQENLEKIFIPFFTTKGSGSGIGLYISRQIIHLHKGLLSVMSRDGETAFLIELPDPSSQENPPN